MILDYLESNYPERTINENQLKELFNEEEIISFKAKNYLETNYSESISRGMYEEYLTHYIIGYSGSDKLELIKKEKRDTINLNLLTGGLILNIFFVMLNVFLITIKDANYFPNYSSPVWIYTTLASLIPAIIIFFLIKKSENS